MSVIAWIVVVAAALAVVGFVVWFLTARKFPEQAASHGTDRPFEDESGRGEQAGEVMTALNEARIEEPTLSALEDAVADAFGEGLLAGFGGCRCDEGAFTPPERLVVFRARPPLPRPRRSGVRTPFP